MTDLRYENITPGIFLDRPNRFIAHVEIGGRPEAVKAGVRVLPIPCHAEPGELKILPGFSFFKKY